MNDLSLSESGRHPEDLNWVGRFIKGIHPATPNDSSNSSTCPDGAWQGPMVASKKVCQEREIFAHKIEAFNDDMRWRREHMDTHGHVIFFTSTFFCD